MSVRVLATVCQRRVDSGFTLIELIVALVLIGVLAAVSTPIFFTRQVFEAQGFYEEALASVRYAQKLAVATGCSVRVDIAGNTLSLWRAAGGPPACNTPPYNTGVADPTGQKATYSLTPPAGSGIAISAANFTFAPLGNTGGGNTTISVTSTSTGTQQFRVWGATGFVERLP